MKFNHWTYTIALITLMLYVFYSISAMGFGGLLLSSAIGLIAASFVDTFEYITIIVVISGVIIAMLYRRMMVERIRHEGFTDGTPKEIINRIETMEKKRKEPVGVYDPRIEGFADVPSDAPESEEEKAAEKGESPESKPATTVRTDEVKATLPDTADDGKKKEAFQQESSGLFKLGEIPSESKEGPHIDAGSTLMKAINSLHPDQIKSMTDNTKEMIESQKNLMSMLQTMRPVLQDGRQLLDTFSNIFGNGGSSGAAGGMFKLGM